jgi:sugar/nucleoside kinase (ribokinase family)
LFCLACHWPTFLFNFDVTIFGEGQLRYSVPAGKRLEQASHFEVNVAGTEANVAGLLARLGWRCGWVSALYDRANTCFTNLDPAQIDWAYLLDTRLLHLSGLTVPLSPSLQAIIIEAVQRAKAAGVPVSFDMNYRQRLWTPSEAAAIVKPIFKEVDLLFCGRGDARRLFGVDRSKSSPLLKTWGSRVSSALIRYSGWINRFRRFTLQPQHNGFIAAVAPAGSPQRAKEFRFDYLHLF